MKLRFADSALTLKMSFLKLTTKLEICESHPKWGWTNQDRPKCQCQEYFQNLSDQTHDNTNDQTLISHCRPSSFWKTVFRQPIDFTKPFRVIWAGEASSDDGGPFREFLLRAMENLKELESYFFFNRSRPKKALLRSWSNQCLGNIEYRARTTLFKQSCCWTVTSTSKKLGNRSCNKWRVFGENRWYWEKWL